MRDEGNKLDYLIILGYLNVRSQLEANDLFIYFFQNFNANNSTCEPYLANESLGDRRVTLPELDTSNYF